MIIIKIIRILDEYRVIVNCGSDDGADIGDYLVIKDRNETIINDPDTREILGAIRLEKAKIIIVQLYPKMCICMNGEKQNSLSIDDLYGISNKYKRLNIEVRDISGPCLYSIGVNDPVFKF